LTVPRLTHFGSGFAGLVGILDRSGSQVQAPFQHGKGHHDHAGGTRQEKNSSKWNVCESCILTL